MAKVTMPQLGESVAEGTIGKWLKQPGDHVAKYEPLLEVITDKVNAEVPSPFEGVLREILVEEGATVPNNAEIAVIETADDSAATDARRVGRPGGRSDAGPSRARPRPRRPPDDRPPRPRSRSRRWPRPGRPGRRRRARRRSPSRAATAPANGDPDARMTPAVRRLLREHGLVAEQIVGTGGGGRITRDDVLAVVETIRDRRQPRPGRDGRAGRGGTWRPGPGGRPAVGCRPGACRRRTGPSSSSRTAPTRSSCR